MAVIPLHLCQTTTSRIKAALSGSLWSWTTEPARTIEKTQTFTWPELQQVVQNFNVLFEVQSARQLLRVDEDAVGVAGRLLTLAK